MQILYVHAWFAFDSASSNFLQDMPHNTMVGSNSKDSTSIPSNSSSTPGTQPVNGCEQLELSDEAFTTLIENNDVDAIEELLVTLRPITSAIAQQKQTNVLANYETDLLGFLGDVVRKSAQEFLKTCQEDAVQKAVDPANISSWGDSVRLLSFDSWICLLHHVVFLLLKLIQRTVSNHDALSLALREHAPIQNGSFMLISPSNETVQQEALNTLASEQLSEEKTTPKYVDSRTICSTDSHLEDILENTLIVNDSNENGDDRGDAMDDFESESLVNTLDTRLLDLVDVDIKPAIKQKLRTSSSSSHSTNGGSPAHVFSDHQYKQLVLHNRRIVRRAVEEVHSKLSQLVHARTRDEKEDGAPVSEFYRFYSVACIFLQKSELVSGISIPTFRNTITMQVIPLFFFFLSKFFVLVSLLYHFFKFVLLEFLTVSIVCIYCKANKHELNEMSRRFPARALLYSVVHFFQNFIKEKYQLCRKHCKVILGMRYV